MINHSRWYLKIHHVGCPILDIFPPLEKGHRRLNHTHVYQKKPLINVLIALME